jgi:hypothetical protein
VEIHGATVAEAAQPISCGGAVSASRRLTRRLPLLFLFQDELVSQVVLVDVADVGHRLAADLLGGDELDVVEPDVGIRAALLRDLAQLRDAAGPAL